MANFYATYPFEGSVGGVPTYANFAAFPPASSVANGSLALALDTDILYVSNGVSWIVIGGPGAALGIGTFDSGVASANGAHIDSNALIMQSASATVPGLVNVSTQTLAGVKTFSSAPNLSSLTASLPLHTDASKNIVAAAIDLAGADVTGILPPSHGGSGSSTAFTPGSVVFAGTSGVYSQDNAHFYWDDTNNRLALGNTAPTFSLDVMTAGATDGINVRDSTGAKTVQLLSDYNTNQCTVRLRRDGINTTGFFSLYEGSTFNDLVSGTVFIANTGDVVSISPGTVGGYIQFATNNFNEKMRLIANGSLGIGTMSPSHLLEVNGTASALSLALAGTSGAGYLDMLLQASPPSTPAASHELMWMRANNSMAFLGSSGFYGELDFSALGASRTFSFPNAAGIVVLTTATQTLTNKTIDGSSNTLTVRLGSDVTGTLPVLNGGTGTTTSTGTGSVVLSTSPTLVTPVLGAATGTSLALSTFEDLTEIATPASPSAGVLRLYSKSGDGLYIKNSAGTELQLSTTAAATPTVAGIVTSYSPVIQSAVSTTTNASATSTTTDGFSTYLFSTGNTDRSLTLPAASANAGREITVKKTDAGSGSVTVTRAGSDTIDGATTFVIAARYEEVHLVCNGSALWAVVSGAMGTDTMGGLVSTTTQAFNGTKTFSAIAFNPTTSGIIGTTTNDNAGAGKVGEYLAQSRVLSAETAMTTNTTLNVTATKLTLTAGDWDIGGMVNFDFNTTTSATVLQAATSLTSATLPATDTVGVASGGEMRAIQYFATTGLVTNGLIQLIIPPHRASLSGTTDFYLVAQATFTVSTTAASGSIWARRVR